MLLGKLIAYLFITIPAAIAVLFVDLLLKPYIDAGNLQPQVVIAVGPYLLALYGAPAPATGDPTPDDTAAYKTVLDTVMGYYGVALTNAQAVALLTPVLNRLIAKYPKP